MISKPSRQPLLDYHDIVPTTSDLAIRKATAQQLLASSIRKCLTVWVLVVQGMLLPCRSVTWKLDPSPPPAGMRCPISHETLVDPVVLVETGHTYERAAISLWLASNDTCPVMRQRLTTKALIPNYGLKRAIGDWRQRPDQGRCFLHLFSS